MDFGERLGLHFRKRTEEGENASRFLQQNNLVAANPDCPDQQIMQIVQQQFQVCIPGDGTNESVNFIVVFETVAQ